MRTINKWDGKQKCLFTFTEHFAFSWSWSVILLPATWCIICSATWWTILSCKYFTPVILLRNNVITNHLVCQGYSKGGTVELVVASFGIIKMALFQELGAWIWRLYWYDVFHSKRYDGIFIYCVSGRNDIGPPPGQQLRSCDRKCNKRHSSVWNWQVKYFLIIFCLEKHHF